MILSHATDRIFGRIGLTKHEIFVYKIQYACVDEFFLLLKKLKKKTRFTIVGKSLAREREKQHIQMVGKRLTCEGQVLMFVFVVDWSSKHTHLRVCMRARSLVPVQKHSLCTQFNRHEWTHKKRNKNSKMCVLFTLHFTHLLCEWRVFVWPSEKINDWPSKW